MSGTEAKEIFSEYFENHDGGSETANVEAVVDITLEANPTKDRAQENSIEIDSEIADEYSNYIENNLIIQNRAAEENIRKNEIVIESSTSPVMEKEINDDPLIKNAEQLKEHQDELAYVVLEDQKTEIRIDQDLSNELINNTKWQIKSINNTAYQQDNSWVNLEEIEAKPEEVKNNNMVLSSEITTMEDGSWLQINVHDFRNDGEGLLGLEIDLEWDEQGMSIDEKRYLKDDIFEKGNLPLFNDVGELTKEGNISQIKGLSAASLPVAMQGKILGLEIDGGTTLFAKIPIKNEHQISKRNLKLEIKKNPAVGGIEVREDQATIVDDRIPKLLFLNTEATQQNVGINNIILVDQITGEEKSIIVNVTNINDAPELKLNSKEIIQKKEKQEIAIEANKFFNDEDKDKLKFEIIPSSQWLQINEVTGQIKGKPQNEDVGLHTFKIRASDQEGLYAEKEVEITIDNVNDRPYIKRAIPNISTSQDTSFKLTVKDNYFSDIDITNDPEEALTFSLQYENQQRSWLQMDPLTGTLAGTPENSDVGEYYYKIKATDRSGESVEQSFYIDVENVNDSPNITKILENIIEVQLKDDEEISNSDLEYSFYTGETKSLDMSQWFDDIDLQVDANEELKINVFYNDKNGEQQRLIQGQNNENQWVNFDEKMRKLDITPNVSDIGKKFLLVSVEDKSRATVTKIVPIQIRHKNTSPFISLPPIEMWRIDDSGVEKIQYDEKGEVHIELIQDQDIEIKLPKSIFADNDLGILPEERLTVKKIGTSILEFNQSKLSFTGSTHNIGLNKDDGYERWTVELEVNDHKNKTTNLTIHFSLQRIAEDPLILKNTDNSGIEINEKDNLTIDNLFEIRNNGNNNTITKIQLKFTVENSGINLKTNNELIDLQHKGNDLWEINTNSKIPENLFDQIIIEQSNLLSEQENVTVDILAYNYIPDTSIKSNVQELGFNIKYNPIAEIPEWTHVGSNQNYQNETLGRLIKAESNDINEKIIYQFKVPDDSDALITDWSGKAIGKKDGKTFILNEEEWNLSTVRSKENSNQKITAKVTAMSVEPSNGISSYGKEIDIEWYSNSLIESQASLYSEEVNKIQYSGKTTTVKTQWLQNDAMISGFIEYKLNSNFQLLHDGKKLNAYKTNDNQSTYRIKINNPNETYQNEVTISNPLDYTEKVEIKIQGFFSEQEEYWKVDEIQKIQDINQKLILKSNEESITWDLINIAQDPEIAMTDNNIPINPKTGELLIKARRGQNEEGSRNKDEQITINISNIPQGFLIAKKSENSFIPCGATDVFGTVTVFVKNPLVTNASVNDYANFADDTIYLIRKNIETIPNDDINLIISATSNIPSETRGETRSNASQMEINIEKEAAKNLPIFGNNLTVIDPIMIDFSGKGIELTNLVDDKQGIQFKMIPSKSSMKTAWLSNKANTVIRNKAAFLVYDEFVDEREGENFLVDNSSQLFSEYFQSPSGIKKWQSGVEALKSLDSNRDLLINQEDSDWNKIKLWFDDGDGETQSGEIKHISNFIDSISLSSVKLITDTPEWAAQNNVLRSFEANEGENIYKMYDIGLVSVPNQNHSAIKFEVKKNIEIKEGNEIGAIKISSEESESWKTSNKDNLTLLRVSGLPTSLRPSLGIQDDLGDWVMTWKSLRDSSQTIHLLQDSDWSGDATIQIMISQLQDDGTIRSSNLQSLMLSVKPTADPPKFITQDQRVEEDDNISLDSIVQLLKSNDRDGSETLGIKIVDNTDLSLKNLDQSGNLVETNFGSFIKAEDLGNYYLAANKDVHGNFVVELIACSIDGNDINESVHSEVNVSFSAVADDVKTSIRLSSSLNLIEGISKPLAELFDIQVQKEILIDSDGSESLEVELLVPSNIVLTHSGLSDWNPIRSTTLANHQKLYVISNSDLNELEIKYISKPGNDPPGVQKIEANYLTRELSNGAINRSEAISSVISIDYNARAPIIIEKTISSFNEDSQVELMSALPTVLPGWKEDLLYLKNIRIPTGLLLIKKGENEIYTGLQENLEISMQDTWFVKAEEHLSGTFDLQYSIEAKPGYGEGNSFVLSDINQKIVVEGLADTPILKIKNDIVDIKSNGWLPFDSFIQLPIESPDIDGSELRYIEFTIEGDDINEQIRFNENIREVSKNTWKVFEESLNTLQIYFGEISTQQILKIRAFSEENVTIQSTDEQQVIVKANATLFAPIIESSGSKVLQEDSLIPILNNDGGSISVITQGNTANQELFVEISGIPDEFTLVKANFDKNETLSKPINISKNGGLASTMLIPFDNLKNTAIKAPNNYYGAFNIGIQAIMRDNKGNEKLSTKQEIEFSLLASNDAPTIDTNALNYTLIEGEGFDLSLDSLVDDVDNLSSELSVGLYAANIEEPNKILPKWLSLTEDNKLIGTPDNEDVGKVSIGLSVSDALGLQNKAVIQIEVGNKNAKPKFNSSSEQLSEWELKLEEESLTYTKSLLIREELILDLYNEDSSGLFLDEDIVYSDKLKYEISTDSKEKWSQNITNFAEIIGNKLYINVKSKLMVGPNQLYIKASDSSGESVIQKFELSIININSPPTVIVPETTKISSTTWTKTKIIKEDESETIGNMFNIFVDEDPFDSLKVMRPTLPPWIKRQDDGSLLAQPGNNHVGSHRLQWQAIDNEKARANFSLELEIENINDAPVVNLPEQINIKQNQILDIDLSQYILDADEINGDTLTYDIKLFNPDGSSLPQPEWLQLRYRSPEPPSGINSLLMTPIIYRLDSQGNEVGRISVDQLDQLNKNQSVRVKVNVYDDRPLEKQGIIGADMTINLNSNLNVASETIKINEDLPLFNNLEFSDGEIKFSAGSAPDALGIGEAIGMNDNTLLLQFDAVIIDNESAIVIDIESNRDNQDALADRYANKLDSSNSLWHSFATKMDARIHFENAKNIDVGNYLISIEATDSEGEVAKKRTTLNVDNVNDRPFLLQKAVLELVNTFKSGTLLEGEERSIESLPLFADPDWIHGSLVEDSLSIEVQFQDELKNSDFLQIKKTGAGSVDLEFNALSGYRTSIDTTFRMIATDSQGETVSTNWINTMINPKSDQTLISTGSNNSPLSESIDNVATSKNTNIRLFEILDSNLIAPKDTEGDEVFVNIRVGNQSSRIKLQGNDIAISETSEKGNLFTISCNEIADLTGQEIGNLRDLEIILPNNEIKPLLKKNSTSKVKFGIPIQVWTDTRVKEDVSGLYGIESSPLYDIQLELKNNRPIFVPQAGIVLDKNNYIDEKPKDILVDMGVVDDMFFDSDINDKLQYSSTVPEKLKDLVSIFIDDKNLYASVKQEQLKNIPNGIYNIVVEAYDSSGQAGDNVSGLRRGMINLVVKDSESTSKRLMGLVQLQNSEPDKILNIFSQSAESLDQDDLEIRNILGELQLTPTDDTPLSDNQKQNIASLINSLVAGESKIMASQANDKSLLLLQTGSGNLMEDAFSVDSPDNLSSITEQITEPNKSYTSPLGQIDFTVLTDAKDYDIVSITIPQNETVDKLLKSNDKGEYKLFSSELIAFDGDPLGLDDWLSSLTYGVYNYRNDSPAKLFNFSPQVNSNIADLFDSEDQYFDFVGSADGSGYLIDTDSDGSVDLINFLILDEGWFDTRKGELYKIGDPLLPLRTVPSTSSDVSTASLSILEDLSEPSPGRAAQAQVVSSSAAANIQSSKTSPISDLSDSIKTGSDSIKTGSDSIKTGIDSLVRANPDIQRSKPSRSQINELPNEQSTVSINGSKGTPNSPNEYGDSKSNIKARPNNDVFMSLPKYLPFSNSLETIIAGIFLLPMGIDRALTFSLGKIKNIPKLLLNKPKRIYKRTWLIPTSTSNSEKVILNCNGSDLTFSTTSLFESEQYEVMPGFTSDGISFLWSSLSPSNIGKSLKAVQFAYHELMTTSRDPKDWILWIDQLKQTAKDARDDAKLDYINRLESIVSNIDPNNLNCIDAFMVAQLNDCATRMGLAMASKRNISS